MKTVDYPEFVSFLSSFPFETQGIFKEDEMKIIYVNARTSRPVAVAHISDKEEPYLHHGIYCKEFKING
jgi:hypothetical protein